MNSPLSGCKARWGVVSAAVSLGTAVTLLGLAACAQGQPLVQVLRSFGSASGDGTDPEVGLLQGRDGMLYGTTPADYSGGANNAGTVFKLNPDGTGYVVLYNFPRTSDAYMYPSGLAQGSDNALYGTTLGGGTNDAGTVYKLNTDGTGYTVLYDFTGTGGDGAAPYAGLIQARDGMLYGTTAGGSYSGTVFKLSTNGTSYSVLYRFLGGEDGTTPYSALIQGSDGVLYGTTSSGGGVNNRGTVFKLHTDGTGYAVLYRFTGSGDGAGPGTLVQSSDGALYGATAQSGSSQGTVFKINTDGSGFTLLHTFGFTGDGVNPNTPLVQGRDGLLYGTTYGANGAGLGNVFRLSTNGTGYTLLYSFTNTHGDAYSPGAGLVQGADGKLYGTSTAGGNDKNGSVFKLNTDGSGYAVVHSFVSLGDKDGARPDFVMQGSDGMLYGTTLLGGTNGGWGTVFRVSTNGTRYALLHCFAGTDGDGLESYGLTQGPDGALYGTSQNGGITNGYSGIGTVYKVNTDGSGYALLHSFTGYRTGDGALPNGPLVLGSDGALYGTTGGGGLYGPPFGDGTVFKLNTDGSGYTILYSFAGNGDGIYPVGALIQGRDGALYGTTERGGAYGGEYSGGTVFTLNTDGSGYTVLYSFGTTPGDGQEPETPLTQGSNGVLYGTTGYHGTTDNGTVFRLNTDGTGYAVLYWFTGGDPQVPAANGVVFGSDGALYGTTFGAFGTYTKGQLIYKLNTDGTGFTVLYTFPAPRVDPDILLQGSDGAFYSTTGSGGDFGYYGTVFRMGAVPPAQLTQPTRLPDRSIQLTLSGAPYVTWRVEIATNLSPPVTWTTLTNLAPTNGVAQFTDLGATSSSRRFYRALWP
jgi:uncharacterized repeat protein (TIGR03803 family)